MSSRVFKIWFAHFVGRVICSRKKQKRNMHKIKHTKVGHSEKLLDTTRQWYKCLNGSGGLASMVTNLSCKVLVRFRSDNFYLHVNQASIADPGFYPHIRIRLFAQIWPIFIGIDLRHFAKISRFLSELKSGIKGDFQGSYCVLQLIRFPF